MTTLVTVKTYDHMATVVISQTVYGRPNLLVGEPVEIEVKPNSEQIFSVHSSQSLGIVETPLTPVPVLE